MLLTLASLVNSKNSALSSTNSKLQPGELKDKDKYLLFYLKYLFYHRVSLNTVNAATALM